MSSLEPRHHVRRRSTTDQGLPLRGARAPLAARETGGPEDDRRVDPRSPPVTPRPPIFGLHMGCPFYLVTLCSPLRYKKDLFFKPTFRYTRTSSSLPQRNESFPSPFRPTSSPTLTARTFSRTRAPSTPSSVGTVPPIRPTPGQGRDCVEDQGGRGGGGVRGDGEDRGTGNSGRHTRYEPKDRE